MAAMEKVFKCLTCRKDIRLERKPDNSGWNKFNLDNTPHVDERKKPSSGDNNNNKAQQIEALTEQVAALTSEVRSLKVYVEALARGLKN